ncbi:hypothetical protein CTA2_1560 [Colletotrichum tanaceti]|uniref:Uncharacterized protein n=1 Tax=Colletotrichum tanaceti TaxID=1306861 RepID=A0A4U6XU26_9PEZI|nr:hypothetical protein CTA2_1560 [Colletotrichum tanaceti]TKW59475.1 hypothetical protein CTA1_11481 [Colletotrichum tanaceti]
MCNKHAHTHTHARIVSLSFAASSLIPVSGPDHQSRTDRITNPAMESLSQAETHILIRAGKLLGQRRQGIPPKIEEQTWLDRLGQQNPEYFFVPQDFVPLDSLSFSPSSCPDTEEDRLKLAYLDSLLAKSLIKTSPLSKAENGWFTVMQYECPDLVRALRTPSASAFNRLGLFKREVLQHDFRNLLNTTLSKQQQQQQRYLLSPSLAQPLPIIPALASFALSPALPDISVLKPSALPHMQQQQQQQQQRYLLSPSLAQPLFTIPAPTRSALSPALPDISVLKPSTLPHMQQQQQQQQQQQSPTTEALARKQTRHRNHAPTQRQHGDVDDTSHDGQVASIMSMYEEAHAELQALAPSLSRILDLEAKMRRLAMEMENLRGSEPGASGGP